MYFLTNQIVLFEIRSELQRRKLNAVITPHLGNIYTVFLPFDEYIIVVYEIFIATIILLIEYFEISLDGTVSKNFLQFSMFFFKTQNVHF